jgi:hypothetical protein
MQDVKDTLIVWRRTGKEHGEEAFRLNTADVVDRSLRHKVEAMRPTAESQWRWWQLSEDLLAEKGGPNSDPGLCFYYLPERHWVVAENAISGSMGPDWPWYVHVADVDWRADLGSWVFTDLFVDVLVHADRRTHTVVDLDDLALAIDLGLVAPDQAARILEHTQRLIDAIRAGDFPPPEGSRGREQLQSRGLLP